MFDFSRLASRHSLCNYILCLIPCLSACLSVCLSVCLSLSLSPSLPPPPNPLQINGVDTCLTLAHNLCHPTSELLVLLAPFFFFFFFTAFFSRRGKNIRPCTQAPKHKPANFTTVKTTSFHHVLPHLLPRPVGSSPMVGTCYSHVHRFEMLAEGSGSLMLRKFETVSPFLIGRMFLR